MLPPEGFWTRQYASYLAEHRHPHNRATHMVGIPILLITGFYGAFTLNLPLFVGGQIVGWAFQLLGHRIEGNKPALLKNPLAWVLGPLMVLVEIVGLLGVRPAFVREAEQAVR